MPEADRVSPISDNAFNLAQSILQQADAHRAFPLRIEFLDKQLLLTGEICIAGHVDPAIKDLLNAVRGGEVYALRIHPRVECNLALKFWFKFLNGYSLSDVVARRSYWTRRLNARVLLPE